MLMEMFSFTEADTHSGAGRAFMWRCLASSWTGGEV